MSRGHRGTGRWGLKPGMGMGRIGGRPGGGAGARVDQVLPNADLPAHPARVQIFVPTCSQYCWTRSGRSAPAKVHFSLFGDWLGCNAAWREGYDPPRWPPAFNAGRSWDDYPGINDPIPDDDADGR